MHAHERFTTLRTHGMFKQIVLHTNLLQPAAAAAANAYLVVGPSVEVLVARAAAVARGTDVVSIAKHDACVVVGGDAVGGPGVGQHVLERKGKQPAPELGVLLLELGHVGLLSR